MCAASSGFTRGLSSGSSNGLESDLSLVYTGILRRSGGTYDCTTAKGGCQIRLCGIQAFLSLVRPKSVTRLAVGGFELVQLRVMLAGEFALRGFPIEIRTGAVVQSRVQ